MNKNLTALLALVAIALGALSFYNASTPKQVVQYVEDKAPSLGAASPEISSPWVRWGGVTVYNARQTFQTATTTLCWLRPDPITGTSTLRSLTVNFTTATGTAAYIVLATSTSRFATSSLDRIIDTDFQLPANVQDTFTFDAGDDNNVVGVNEYVWVGTGTPGQSGYRFGGTCQATFQPVQ